ncbi:MAG: hypothetical protein LBR80_13215 [Deltaproteobacteria bacterium]|nr:hypothetical protein [Deltaproteobacteria bacterium]
MTLVFKVAAVCYPFGMGSQILIYTAIPAGGDGGRREARGDPAGHSASHDKGGPDVPDTQGADAVQDAKARADAASPAAAWELLKEALEQGLTADEAAAIAEPEEGEGGKVAWSTPLTGAPRDFFQLTGAERRLAERALRERAEAFARAGAALSSDVSPGTRAAARLLLRLSAALAAAAAGIPGPESVFVVGGVPVMAAWWRGYSEDPGAGAAVPGDADVPPLPTGGEGAGESGLGEYPDASLPPPPSPLPLPRPDGSGGPIGLGVRTALAALGVFLLALTLILLMSPAFRRAASAIPGDGSATLPDPWIEDDLRFELDYLQDRYRDTLLACRPDDDPEPFFEEYPPDLPEPERRDLTPPSAGEGPAALEAAPPPPPPPAPPPRVRPRPGSRPKPPAGANRPPRGGQLRIPDNPTDLSFLEGCWKSDAGMVDRINQMPLTYIYCFSPSGSASVKVQELDRSGSIRNVCTTNGRATLSGGRVIIRDNGAKCPPGIPSYERATVTCTPSPGGAASCRVRNQSGNSFSTRFTFQGG